MLVVLQCDEVTVGVVDPAKLPEEAVAVAHAVARQEAERAVAQELEPRCTGVRRGVRATVRIPVRAAVGVDERRARFRRRLCPVAARAPVRPHDDDAVCPRGGELAGGEGGKAGVAPSVGPADGLHGFELRYPPADLLDRRVDAVPTRGPDGPVEAGDFVAQPVGEPLELRGDGRRPVGTAGDLGGDVVPQAAAIVDRAQRSLKLARLRRSPRRVAQRGGALGDRGVCGPVDARPQSALGVEELCEDRARAIDRLRGFRRLAEDDPRVEREEPSAAQRATRPPARAVDSSHPCADGAGGEHEVGLLDDQLAGRDRNRIAGERGVVLLRPLVHRACSLRVGGEAREERLVDPVARRSDGRVGLVEDRRRRVVGEERRGDVRTRRQRREREVGVVEHGHPLDPGRRCHGPNDAARLRGHRAGGNPVRAGARGRAGGDPAAVSVVRAAHGLDVVGASGRGTRLAVVEYGDVVLGPHQLVPGDRDGDAYRELSCRGNGHGAREERERERCTCDSSQPDLPVPGRIRRASGETGA